MTPSSLYSAISFCCISAFDSRSVLPLYWFCSVFTLGWIRCIAAIERSCVIVSGRIRIRTVTVRATIAQPHDRPWSL